jgi:phage gpG-like protein
MGIERIGNWNLNRVLKAFDSLKKNDLPLLVGKKAQNHFIQGFRQGGKQTDASAEGWPERTTKDKSDKRNPNRNRAILVKTAHLMKSVSLLEYKFERIVIGTKGIPYALRHNEGITDSKGRKMPKREFIGKSAKLDIEIIKLIRNKIDNIWKS